MVDSTFEVIWEELKPGGAMAMKPLPTRDEIEASQMYVRLHRPELEPDSSDVVEIELMILNRIKQCRIERKILLKELRAMLTAR